MYFDGGMALTFAYSFHEIKLNKGYRVAGKKLSYYEGTNIDSNTVLL